MTNHTRSHFDESAPATERGLGPSLRPLSHKSLQGVSMIELMIAVAILIMMAGISLWALSSDNRVAATNRNLIAAKAIAQARIDEAQSVIYTTTGTVPAVLATGTVSSAVTIAEDTNTPITGTMTTTGAVADATLSIRRVTVTVTYTYRARQYSITLATARAPD